MTVPFLDLVAQYQGMRDAIDSALERVAVSGHYILGEEVEALEREIAGYVGVPHAVGVASGTDALIVALRAAGIGRGDEVVVPSFTFFATAGAVVHAGAEPVFADIEPGSFNLDPRSLQRAITPRTRAVIPVHLFGQCADMEAIGAIASEHGLVVVEDAAQAIGARFGDQGAGSIGELGCFSFFPTKNLGGFGDGGLVTTASAELDTRLRLLRVHGSGGGPTHTEIGYNSRLDALQAAVLRAKLEHLESWTEARRSHAAIYCREFESLGLAVD